LGKGTKEVQRGIFQEGVDLLIGVLGSASAEEILLWAKTCYQSLSPQQLLFPSSFPPELDPSARPLLAIRAFVREKMPRKNQGM